MTLVQLLAVIGFAHVVSLTYVTHHGRLENRLLPAYRAYRQMRFKRLHRQVESDRSHMILYSKNKLQDVIDCAVPFPCPLNNTRSHTKPKSVHELRPGDVDVVGAIGDSLTAGTGLKATNVFQVLYENRGLSPTAGGQGTWREYLTIPNILKVFNPDLIGYSRKSSLTSHMDSQFNVAETGAISSDIPYMARLLINRMRSHPEVNVTEDWKIISLMIGPNDFCTHLCYSKNLDDVIEQHRRDLVETFRILRDNLPKTLLYLVIAPNLKKLVDFKNKPRRCHVTHIMECPCLFGPRFDHMQQQLIDIMNEWQRIEMEVATYEEFDTDNFTIVALPFSINYSVPNKADGTTDYSYMSEDCFHFSQKGNARIVNALWNNLLEPVGQKSFDGGDTFQIFRCPTFEHPYIFTRRNSGYR